MCVSEPRSLSSAGEVPYQGDGVSSEAGPHSAVLLFALCLPKAVPVRVINSSRSAMVVGSGTRHTRFISALLPLRGRDLNG